MKARRLLKSHWMTLCCLSLLSSPLWASTVTVQKLSLDSPPLLQIDIVSARPSKEQQELLTGLKQSLKDRYKIHTQEKHIYWQKQKNWSELLSQSTSKLIISLGDETWDKVNAINSDKIHLGLNVSTGKLNQLQQTNAPLKFAISHDQPIKRYFYLLKALELDDKPTAILFNQNERLERLATSKLASKMLIDFNPIQVNNQQNYSKIIKQLSTCCSVLLFNTNQKFISGLNRKSIMMNSYRNRIIVIGNSIKLLKEGAMLALLTRPYDMGSQAADLLAKMLQKKEPALTAQTEQTINDFPKIDKYQYPKHFYLNSNHRIEKMLGLVNLSLGKLSNHIKNNENGFISKELIDE